MNVCTHGNFSVRVQVLWIYLNQLIKKSLNLKGKEIYVGHRKQETEAMSKSPNQIFH